MQGGSLFKAQPAGLEQACWRVLLEEGDCLLRQLVRRQLPQNWQVAQQPVQLRRVVLTRQNGLLRTLFRVCRVFLGLQVWFSQL